MEVKSPVIAGDREAERSPGLRRRRRRWLPLVILVGAAPAGWYGLNGLGTVLEDPSRYPGLERFAAVEAGTLYRSGQLSGEDFAAAMREHGIKTVLCVRGGYRNPLQNAWFRRETDYCREHGVNFVHAPMSSDEDDPENVAAIRRFWELVDDPANHPILVHCEAGVDRTGVLSYLYRIHRQGWSREDARREMMERGASRRRVEPILDQATDMDHSRRERTARIPGQRSSLPPVFPGARSGGRYEPLSSRMVTGAISATLS